MTAEQALRKTMRVSWVLGSGILILVFLANIGLFGAWWTWLQVNSLDLLISIISTIGSILGQLGVSFLVLAAGLTVFIRAWQAESEVSDDSE